MNLLLTFICNIINISTVIVFALCNRPTYSCSGGNDTKPSTCIIALSVGG